MPTLTFKVTPEEAARIRALARRSGCTVSELLRRRAIEGRPGRLPARRRYRIKKSPSTGLPVMHAPQDVPRITSQEVRALLADFP